MTEIVITGLGATTPLGGDLASTWAGLLAGKSGVTRIAAEWADELPAKIAASAAVDPSEVIDRVKARRLDRSTQLALIAAQEAWTDAGYDWDAEEQPDVDPHRLIVSLASGIGGLHSLLNNWDVQRDKGYRRVSPFTIPMLMANAPAANVGMQVHAKAGVHTPVSACASSNEAIALALDQLRLGRAEVAVVGGTIRSRSARTDARVSRAPAPPSRWPVIDLVEVTTQPSTASPRPWRIELASVTSPCGVEVPWAFTCLMSERCRPESMIAFRIAPNWPSPEGSGWTMSWLSAVMPAPARVP